MNRGVELFEIAAAMADHRLAESLEGFRRNLDGAGNEELGMHGGLGKPG